jgi:hypothetical protein
MTRIASIDGKRPVDALSIDLISDAETVLAVWIPVSDGGGA